MARDARFVLNKRRKQQQLLNLSQRQQPNTTQVNDARQLLKMKKFQGINKAKSTRQNFTSNSNWNSNRRPFKRPFFKNFGQRGLRTNTAQNTFDSNRLPNRTNFNKRTFDSNRPPNRTNFDKRFQVPRFQAPNKTVQVAKSGIIKITSRAQNQPKPVPSTSGNLRFVSSLSGLTVTARNRPIQNQMLIEEVDNGDELEHMTLQDIPEINRMRDVPQSLLLQKKTTPAHWELPGSSKSTLFSRLAKSMETTMVADTLPTSMPFSHPCWKVVVTNLHSSVSDDDIVELFGHVGTMKSADIVQPGMAIIEYFSKEDAMKAYDMYHNRLLDGYPMQCVMQPDSGRSTVTSRLGERFMPSSSQPSTSSILQPSSSRRVAFTVQLP